MAINTNEEDVELAVPAVTLEAFELYDPNLGYDSQDCYQPGEILSVQDPDGCKISQNAHDHRVLRVESERVKQVKDLLRLEDLNTEERVSIEKLIEKNSDLFHIPGQFLDHTNAVEHRISTTDERPVFTRQYRFPPAHKDEIAKQVGDLINGKIIEPSESPYSSPLWIVPKKADSQGKQRWRMVIDYRNLNEKTIGDAYPLPCITEILDQLGSAKYFSVFDLASGFHQIRMHPSDAHKTAFSTPFGHYQFNRMPFGLKNAPATFQRLMDRVLCGLQGNELFVYLDDIVIYASSLREHEIKFEKLAERLRKANLKLQPDKCEFLRKEVAYLGHVISEDGVKPDPKKIEAIKNYPRLTSQKKIKQFLGLAGYYRRFVENFSAIARPLTQLLKKEALFKWTQNQEDAFIKLRDALCKEPVLQYPDFTRPFIITTDASNIAIGGILSQGKIGSDKPISYASRTLSKAELNYSTIEKELLAIVYCVGHFRPYVYGREFTLVTDHKPLVWLDSVKDPANRLVHWRLKLANYEYKIVYKPGRVNANADALSRNPPERETPVNEKSVLLVMPIRFRTREDPSETDSDEIPAKRQKENPPNTDPTKEIKITSRKRSKKLIADSDSDEIPTKREKENSPLPDASPADAPTREKVLTEKRARAQSSNSDSEGIFETRPKKKPKAPDISNSENNQSESSQENQSDQNNSGKQIISDPPSDASALSSYFEKSETFGSSSDPSDPFETNENQNPENKTANLVATPSPSIEANRVERPSDQGPSGVNEQQKTGSEISSLETEIRDDRSETSIDPNSDSDSSSEIFDENDVPYERNVNEQSAEVFSVKETRDRLIMQKDNIIFFVTTKGQPIDSGAEDLVTEDRLPVLNNLNLTRANVKMEKSKYLIALPVKADLRANTALDDLIESFQSLRDVIIELGLKSASIARTNRIDNLTWAEVQARMTDTLRDLPFSLTICNQLVRIPPEPERRNIIEENHDSLVGGHKGVNKTYKRIRERFYWENMKAQVGEYIQQCRGCQLKKLVRVKTKQPMVITDTPGRAFDKISMDIVGPLPTTKKGNTYILTIQDLLSKYSLAIPLSKTSSMDIADAFAKQFISRFGAPRGLLTDQGSNFTSSLMKALARKFRIKQYRTTAYHPQSNGSIERSHHVLAEYLKQYVDGHHEWDEFIELAMFSYNTSKHEGTGFTPFELVFGRTARQPSTYTQIEEHQDETYVEYLKKLFEKVHGLQELAAENLKAAKERSKQYYDRRANPQNFGVGSKVLMLKEPNTGKFCDQYTGPYEVIEVLSGGNVKINHNQRPRIVHTNKLRLTRL